MNVRIGPELEKLIREDVERGTYSSVEEYVEHAVTMLHERERWLAENRTEVRAKIEEGVAAAERGELLNPDEVRAMMERRKREFLKSSEA
jgi:antitoxin ParD1/3/4